MNYEKLKKQSLPGPWVQKPDFDDDIVIEDCNKYVVFRCVSGKRTNQQLLTPERLASIKLTEHCVNKFDKALAALKYVLAKDGLSYSLSNNIRQIVENTVKELEEVEGAEGI